MSYEDIKYGVHGKTAELGDMSGGAEQIVTPFRGDVMLDLGIMENFDDKTGIIRLFKI